MAFGSFDKEYSWFNIALQNIQVMVA